MKYIKIFEDYSEEELNDLIGDLEGIGHKGRLTRGEDFGFGTSLKEENDGAWFFSFPEKTIEILTKKGILRPFPNAVREGILEFANSKEWTEGKKHHIEKKILNDGNVIWRMNMPGTSLQIEIEILGKIAEKLGKVIL